MSQPSQPTAEEEFLRWAVDIGALGLHQVSITYLEKNGVLVRSLVAAKEVTEPILLPRNLLLMAENDMDLAWRLARERLRMEDGQVSSLAPWIRILPSEEMLKEYHVAYASDSVLETFAALPLTSRVQHWKQSVCNVWQDRKSEFMDVSFDAFKWAATILQTRVFRPPPSFCFMPVADMMNTSLTPNMEVYDSLELEEAPEDITNSPASASSNMGYYGLLPLREIMQGEELTQAYCAVDNSERLFRCGFLLPENPTAVEPLSRRSVEAMCRQAESLEGPRDLLESLRALALEHAEAP